LGTDYLPNPSDSTAADAGDSFLQQRSQALHPACENKIPQRESRVWKMETLYRVSQICNQNKYQLL
jgi:hypothetical protein